MKYFCAIMNVDGFSDSGGNGSRVIFGKGSLTKGAKPFMT